MTNPYRAPKTTPKAQEQPPPDAPTPGSFLRDIVVVAAGVVVLRVALDAIGLRLIAAWTPAAMGAVVAVMASRAAAWFPNGSWTGIAAVVTVLGYGVLFVAPLLLAFPALIAPLPHVIGLAIVVGRVGAHERAAKVRENRRIRDEDQRAQFAEEERREERGPIRPAAPVRGGLRMACSECGELTDESELMFDDGVRRCASCAATS